MKLGWTTIAFGSVLLLAGCGKPVAPTKSQDAAECRMKATAVYAHYWQSETESDAMGDFTAICMKAKGYVRTQDACTKNATWAMKASPTCYRVATPQDVDQ